MENLKEKKVRDIMIPIYEYPIISSGATLKTTLQLMQDLWHLQVGKPKTGRRHVVVFEDNLPVGTFGINEMFKAIEPKFLDGLTLVGMKLPSSSVPIFWEGLFTEQCMEVAQSAIRKYTTLFEQFANADDSLLRASCHMAKYKVDFLPVKSNNRLVGMVLNEDIFKEITALLANCESFTDTRTDRLA